MGTKRYYSRNGEDYLAWSLFDDQRPGFFVDVGAFDGVHLSNTFSFERHGWKGICIEPHPAFVRMCARNRRKSLCLHAACVSQPEIDRVEFLTEPLGLLSGIRANQNSDLQAGYALRGMAFPGFTTATVPARTLNRIFKQHLPPKTAIDLLSIDVEGGELDILRGLDFAEYAVRIIVAGANTPKAAEELAAHLTGAGYFLARQLEQNLFFVRDSDDAQVLRHARIECLTEMTLHPMGARATVREHVGRTIRVVSPNRVCDNALRQEPGQSLYELLKPSVEASVAAGRAPGHHRFAHIINTYSSPPGSAAHTTQEFTFGALERAKELAKGKADVDLVSVNLAEDMNFPPPIFRKAEALERTVLDIENFHVPRKLPLVFDIVEKGIAAAGDAEFIVFSNADICPMPHFYEFVSSLLDLGFDTLLINRRVAGTFPLDKRWRSLFESDYGGPHPGFDCFVFPAKFARQFVRGNSCVGIPYVMRGLLYNLVALSRNMLILTDVHATYHIGSDSAWNHPELEDYTRFNRNQTNTVLDGLAQNPAARRRLRDFCKNHQEEFAVPEISGALSPIPAARGDR
jgi:FkbM family methyltransferase